MLFTRILDFVLETGTEVILTFDYAEAFEPLTGKKISGASAEHIVDSLLKNFADEFVCCFLDFRKKGSLQIYSNVVFDQLN